MGTSGRLSRFGQERLGFSQIECYGIMDGWDRAAGRTPRFVDDEHLDPAGYGRGFELGRRCWEAVKVPR